MPRACPWVSKVFLVENGQRKHITNPTTFNHYGYLWNNVQDVNLEEITSYPLGSPITLQGNSESLPLSGGIISGDLEIQGNIKSSRLYQKDGDLILSTMNSGMIILSAAQGTYIQGQQIILDAQVPPGSGTARITLRDPTTILENIDAQNGLDVTGASLTVGGSNFTVDTSGNVTTTGTLQAGATTLSSATLSGNLDLANNLILNIGASGTDFTSSGGLTLAGLLQAANGLNVTGADFTVGGTNFTVDTSGNLTLAGDLTVNTNTLYVDSTNNRIGIGTTTPSALTHLVQTGDSDAFRVDDEASDTTPFVIDADGNVGIGTTGPSEKLTISGRGISSVGSGASTIWSVLADKEFVGHDEYISQGMLIGPQQTLGKNWSDLGQQASQTQIFSLAYLGNGIVLAGANGHILRSTDYGAAWSDLGQQFSQTHIQSLTYLGNGIVLAGTWPDGKILRSTDYGATWSDLDQQFSQTDILSFAYLGNGIVLAGTDGKILRSTDYIENPLGQYYWTYDENANIFYSSGDVGIATTTPARLLSVWDGGAYVCSTSDGSCPISDTAGDIYATSRSGGEIDVAEWIKVGEKNKNLDENGNSMLEPGDLLCIDSQASNKVIACTSSYDENIIAVVSTKPHLTMGAEYQGDDAVRMTLTGRVPVKVSTENGPINIGDYLTSSSQPGVAMKATKPGPIIGKALESYNDEGIGKIMVFINVGWYGGELTEDGQLARGDSSLSSLHQNSILDNFVNLTKNALEKLGLYLESGIAQIKEIITDKITTKLIQFEKAQGDKAQIDELEVDRIRMRDQATGQIYCTWIENGEWIKLKGECEGVKIDNK